ncbi:DUF4144 family protein [Thalassotalea aquiviva]|uniref:DUF4144 family protein n=1 Tax=Thalassotalea aquiviva TaxID=3242415 RepID=UPI00352A2345
MIHFPALVRHDNEDELIYIDSLQDWQNDEEMLLYIFTERDVLIDSTGQVFLLPDVQENLTTATPIANATVENITELVQAHVHILGHCCSEKIRFNTVSEAIAAIKDLQ